MPSITVKIFPMHVIIHELLFFVFDRMNDISVFKQVLDIPEFKANPAATIVEHLRNKLKQEEQMDT